MKVQILNDNDGREKAKKMTYHLKTRKIFNPTKTSSYVFSEISPIL